MIAVAEILMIDGLMVCKSVDGERMICSGSDTKIAIDLCVYNANIWDFNSRRSRPHTCCLTDRRPIKQGRKS